MTTEKWYPFIKLPLTIEQFDQLPRNPAYKYEYIEGEAWLTARPRTYHALLALEKRTPASTVEGFGREEISVRKLDEDDWEEFPSLFAWAFHRVVPFSLISVEDRLTAATQCLEHVRKGGDGPLIKDACYVARCDTAEGERLLGAILITLMQNGELERFDDPTWKEHAPDNALAAGWGRPHLTWIFTDHWNARHGIGSLLLDHAVNALLDLGYTELASTFLLGNESSTLWHWRNGFQLKSYPGSPRALDRRSTANPTE
ncbi:MAG: hypothetical protein R3C02_17395 [Planctomycetaceae bacterium]